MTISIGGLGPQPRTDISEGKVDHVTSSVANKASQSAEAGTEGATTALMSSAASLAALTKIAMNGDETRARKVEQLRHDVAAGTYKLEPTKIADALLAEWQ